MHVVVDWISTTDANKVYLCVCVCVIQCRLLENSDETEAVNDTAAL